MPYCTECGAELEEGARFCTECGTPVEPDDAVTEPLDPTSDTQMEPPPAPQPATPVAASPADTASQQLYPEAPPQQVYQEPQPPAPQRPRMSTGGVVALTLSIVAVALVGAFGIFFFVNTMNSPAPEVAAAEVAAEDEAVEPEAEEPTEAEGEATTQEEAAPTQQPSTNVQITNNVPGTSSQPSTSMTTPAPSTQSQSTPLVQPDVSSSSGATTSSSSSYIIPDSDSRALSRSDIDGLSTLELFYARNEIQARHGRMFNTPELQDYFNSQSWYEPLYEPDYFESHPDLMTQLEWNNMETIKALEQERNSPYLGLGNH